jgi:hypothetical protein
MQKWGRSTYDYYQYRENFGLPGTYTCYEQQKWEQMQIMALAAKDGTLIQMLRMWQLIGNSGPIDVSD